MKKCRKCRRIKPTADFSREGGRCRACLNKLARQKYRLERSTILRKRREKGPEIRIRRLQLKYGLTEEDFLEKLNSQAGLCGICKEILNRPCVDHDHRTGRVRGLLCSSCNTGIGSLKDNPSICIQAAVYLRQYGAEEQQEVESPP